MKTAQNAHLTFKANMGVGRHGWLRLTPAYSVALVRKKVAHLPAGSIVTDPFSGTGTTPLAATEHGHLGQSLDINPFLVWLGEVKTRNFSEGALEKLELSLSELLDAARRSIDDVDLWQPKLFNIERWWPASALQALKAIRSAIETIALSDEGRDLCRIALCRTLIASSSAAFNHQSMSFKRQSDELTLYSPDEAASVVSTFAREIRDLIGSARMDLDGSARVLLGDSRSMVSELDKCDLLLTSPPYVNRMSYIRELRPYMYWLGFLDVAADAGELDWEAIGGTWGIATSRVGSWTQPHGSSTPVDDQLSEVCGRIATSGGNGPLLSNYVAKYFHDMWAHFNAARQHVKSGGVVSYIVGNSTFYGHIVPTEEWYSAMLRSLGFEQVAVQVIRKRNSNKHLYEFDVSARMP